ncbi:FAD-binding oxidoreductase [Ammoniphilus sp. CFH 90114]|uniref:FAD-binding oxidoreductase n=1 Tax=Ammoniphilus sp. CFH 90114 TaxID=2493665 RepID=UPI00100E8CCC|nr:FAD-linked oxidase C-terminal domain-containing protein [Ammoniphilus sp. CFH 90114]RXT04869.1 FAD-binding protein [Ammoniphilus sp. CFH 90114]
MKILEELRAILTEGQVTINPTVLEQHGRDESLHPPHLPDVVVFPKSAVEVSRILQYASLNHIPVVPFGVGSSLEGAVIPYEGGISMDFQLMNQIIEVRPYDFLVRVQPGVTRNQLNKELKKHGLFFTVDPGADATLGGMAATNASGTTSVRYGVMRDQVRDLEVVLADGRMIRTGGMSAKSSSGYHLNGLFVGSEGTLGVFTELTLRVYGIPEVIMAARAAFPSIGQAVDAAVSILSAGIPVARIELVDARSIRQANKHSGTDYPEKPTLFLEFHGNEAGLKQDAEFAEGLALEQDCEEFVFETDSLRRAQLWEARHNLAYAYSHGNPGKKMMLTDVCVPLSALTESVTHAGELIDQSGLDGCVVGHIGDGNFHTLVLIDASNPHEVERAEKVNAGIVEHALERGGTCTGEHGVGIGKRKYQRKEHGEALDVMKQMKQMLDPNHILNPGKVLP